MRSNRKHTTADLIYYIHLYEDGYSYRELSEKFGLLLSDATFYRYYLKFMEHGMAGLESSRKNNSYSQAFKENIVQEYLQTDCSIIGLARKYNIPAPSTVKKWIIKYNEGEQIRDYRPKPEVYTMKAKRKHIKKRLRLSKTF